MGENGMDARELLDALEMRLGSMDQRRVLAASAQPDNEQADQLS